MLLDQRGSHRYLYARLAQDMPPLQFLPLKNRVPNASDYRCPCYKAGAAPMGPFVGSKGIVSNTDAGGFYEDRINYRLFEYAWDI